MRLKVQGFIVFDFAKQYKEATSALLGWYRDGRLKLREDVRDDGLEAFPTVLRQLYTGGNFGKLVLKL
jgi:NADPH-dependent curcumin reductase CurA